MQRIAAYTMESHARRLSHALHASLGEALGTSKLAVSLQPIKNGAASQTCNSFDTSKKGVARSGRSAKKLLLRVQLSRVYNAIFHSVSPPLSPSPTASLKLEVAFKSRILPKLLQFPNTVPLSVLDH